MISVIRPEDVETWFPLDRQQQYVDHIIGRLGLTPTQVRHMVRLWGYGYCLKHLGHDHLPLKKLESGCYRFFCSQGEASNLFYGEAHGTSRSAGLMIKQLVTKQFIKCEKFSGSKTRLYLYIPKEFELPDGFQDEEVESDYFTPSNDAVPVAQFLMELYRYDNDFPRDASYNILQGLEKWMACYPLGLKVLRYTPSKKPIGFSAVFPVHPESSQNFYLPPQRSSLLHKFDTDQQDPIQCARPNDLDCRIAYIPSCQIQPEFWTFDNTLRLLNETKATIQSMRANYPKLSDVYSMTIHPLLEEFALAIGFQVMNADSNTSLRWLHMPLDRFLSMDSESALLNFNYPYQNF
jgi:hypothetical protein